MIHIHRYSVLIFSLVKYFMSSQDILDFFFFLLFLGIILFFFKYLIIQYTRFVDKMKGFFFKYISLDYPYSRSLEKKIDNSLHVYEVLFVSAIFCTKRKKYLEKK